MNKKMGIGKALITIALVLVMCISSLSVMSRATASQENTRGENILIVAMQDDAQTLNVIAHNDVWSWHILKYIYDAPVGTDPVTDELIPWIAIRSGDQPDRLFGCDYDPAYTNLDDPADHYNPRKVTVEYDFTGVKWHDGENVTIDDILFSTYTCALSAKYTTSFQCLMDLGGVGDTNFTATHWMGITKVNETTLHFELQTNFALFYRSTLAPFLIPKHIWEQFGDPMLAPDKPGAMDSAAFKSLMEWDPSSPSEIVGCGPMKFVEWSKGAFAKSAKYEDFFYHQKPTIDGVLYRIYKTTDAATMALRNGDVDLVAWAIPPDYIPDLMNDPNIGISSAAEPGFFYLAFNMRKKDFGYDAAGEDFGKPFRKAVAHCVDKKAIVTSLLQNFGVAADGPVSPANTLWFNDSLPTYAFDVDKAKDILDAAYESTGYYNIGPNGWRVLPTIGDKQFEILTPPADYDPIRSAAGLMIAQQMQAAGINAVSKPTAFAQICDCVDARAFDMYILGWNIGGLDPDYLYDFFYSGNALAGINYPGYNSPEFDELVLASRAEMNETKRVELIKECQGILVEDLPYDVLYYRQQIEAYRADRFTNWTLYAGSIFKYWSVITIKAPSKLYLRASIDVASAVASDGTETVTVTVRDQDLSPVEGANVIFSPVTEGTISPETGTTDANGQFIATFTAPHVETGEDDITVVITLQSATKEGYDAAPSVPTKIVVKPAGAQFLAVKATPLTDIVLSEGVTTIDIKVTDQDKNLVNGATVTLTVDPSTGTVSPSSGTTVDGAIPTATFTAPKVTVDTPFHVTITANKTGYDSEPKEITIDVLKPVVIVRPTPALGIMPLIASIALAGITYGVIRRRRK